MRRAPSMNAGGETSALAISRARWSLRAGPWWPCCAATLWVSSISELTIASAPPPPGRYSPRRSSQVLSSSCCIWSAHGPVAVVVERRAGRRTRGGRRGGRLRGGGRDGDGERRDREPGRERSQDGMGRSAPAEDMAGELGSTHRYLPWRPPRQRGSSGAAMWWVNPTIRLDRHSSEGAQVWIAAPPGGARPHPLVAQPPATLEPCRRARSTPTWPRPRNCATASRPSGGARRSSSTATPRTSRRSSISPPQASGSRSAAARPTRWCSTGTPRSRACTRRWSAWATSGPSSTTASRATAPTSTASASPRATGCTTAT